MTTPATPVKDFSETVEPPVKEVKATLEPGARPGAVRVSEAPPAPGKPKPGKGALPYLLAGLGAVAVIGAVLLFTRHPKGEA